VVYARAPPPHPRRAARIHRPPAPSRGDEDPKLVIGEAGVVGDVPRRRAAQQCIEQDAENGRERAEQNVISNLITTYGGIERSVAAEHERPIVRHVQRHPGAMGSPQSRRST